jgi:hypothetical protein
MWSEPTAGSEKTDKGMERQADKRDCTPACLLLGKMEMLQITVPLFEFNIIQVNKLVFIKCALSHPLLKV